MRKYVFLICTLVLSFHLFAQKSGDPELDKRLTAYMQLNRQLNFEALMDYTHPKIFQLASKEQLVALFQQSFDNEAMRIGLDSTGITTVSPPFKVGDTLYRKIDYWMAMNILLKDTAAANDENFTGSVKASLENGFPGATINFDKARHQFFVFSTSIMMAIKDGPKSPWLFLGYQNNGALLKMLYPQEVIDHFKLL